MSDLLIHWFVIPTIVVAVVSAAYWLLKRIADYNRYLDGESQKLENYRKHLDKRSSDLEQAHLIQVHEVSQKKSEVIRKYQKSLDAIKIAEKIREDIQLKINTLLRENKQLHEELTAARQRAKRLAKKSQLAV